MPAPVKSPKPLFLYAASPFWDAGNELYIYHPSSAHRFRGQRGVYPLLGWNLIYILQQFKYRTMSVLPIRKFPHSWLTKGPIMPLMQKCA
jgi:hypothetical protein